MEQIVMYTVKPVTLEKEARRVSAFLLSEYSFDDQRFTPGEVEHFTQNPLLSVHLPYQNFWYVDNEEGEVIGIISVMENEQRTGGYIWDYIAVHRNYRKHGIAGQLYDAMLNFVEAQGGRYITAYTCELPEYTSVKKMFIDRGFNPIGYSPDYYYKDEARLTFHKKLL